jgi:hypothetical protein
MRDLHDPVQSIIVWERSMFRRLRDRRHLTATIIVLLCGAAGLPVVGGGVRAAQPAEQTQTGHDSTGLPGGRPSAPPATVEGFRGAHFGMNEQQVRQIIREEFPAAAITTAMNPSEKTTVLSVTVTDLLPDIGNARISYILGYRSKKLVQVNLLWTSDRSASGDEALVGAANTLRDYFTSESYKPEKTIANRQIAEDTIIVFRTSDLNGRTILLVISGTPATAHTNKPGQSPLTLELAYIEDPAHPDIFRIAKGQF